jgi:hypothetical protein
MIFKIHGQVKSLTSFKISSAGISYTPVLSKIGEFIKNARAMLQTKESLMSFTAVTLS